MSYCLVRNGIIIDGPRDLPFSWNNITGLNKHPNPEVFGWYPFVASATPPYDADAQLSTETLTVDDVAKVVNQGFDITDKPFAEAFEAIAARNRMACQTQIYSVYSAETQLSAFGGVLGEAVRVMVRDYIKACKTEEDRVFDLLEAATITTVDELIAIEKPNYPKG